MFILSQTESFLQERFFFSSSVLHKASNKRPLPVRLTHCCAQTNIRQTSNMSTFRDFSFWSLHAWCLVASHFSGRCHFTIRIFLTEDYKWQKTFSIFPSELHHQVTIIYSYKIKSYQQHKGTI